MLRLLLLLLALIAGAQAAPLPEAVRGLWYPLDARRDGRPLDAPGVVARTRELGCNLLLLPVAAGPAADDAALLLDAAQAAGLPVALWPRTETVSWRARFGRHPALAAWLISQPDPATAQALRGQPPVPVLGLTAEPDAAAWRGVADALLSELPVLFEPGGSYGGWASQLKHQRASFGGPLLGTLPAAPPDWFVAQQALQSAAPHPDLYRTSRERPETACRLAGEYLLVPEPAQLRLAAYAALSAGVGGVTWDHAGHLCDGPAPYNGRDRALAVAQLNTELVWLEPYLHGAETVPLPGVPQGMGASLHRQGERWVFLLWRDRVWDSRSVTGATTPDLRLLLPVPAGQPLQLYTLTPGGAGPAAADLRDGGLLLTIPEFDLTAAYVITPTPLPELAAQLRAALPEQARLEREIARERLAKVATVLARLDPVRRPGDGREWAAAAAETLLAADYAAQHGYQLSALDLARESGRLLRLAQAAEFEPALLQPLLPRQSQWDRWTFASLPWLRERRNPAPTEPYQLPLALDFESGGLGRPPERWRAWRGFDQTVAALTLTERDGRFLRWVPGGPEPGAVGLPFPPQTGLEVALRLRAAAFLGGDRAIMLAPSVETQPLGGLTLRPDGAVVATLVGAPPPGPARRYVPGTWHAVNLRLAGGQLAITWDGQTLLPPTAVQGQAGALVLAKFAGADAVALDLDDLSVAPGG